MIRVVMFDLGQTLIDAHNKPFPHVEQALAAIADLRTADGRALRSCLVSDYDMPASAGSTQQIGRIFRQYLQLLQACGLRALFEPVQRRVTLSCHAGVFKPQRALFEAALRRLRAAVALKDCLLVTENAAHARAVRQQLGMQALRFRSGSSADFDFEDWSQAPALIAHLVAPHHPANLRAAVRAHLAAQGVELDALERDAAGHLQARGRIWQAVSVPGLAPPELHVALPVSAELSVGSKGALQSRLRRPGPGEREELRQFVASLARQGQIAQGAESHGGMASHEITTDAQGRRCLQRRRFSAR